MLEKDEPLKERLGKLDRGAEKLKDLVPHARDGIPSKPLLGVLPLRRLIPQDVHSVLDYVSSAGLEVAGLCGSATAKMAGLMLSGSVLMTSLLTDYRLSVAKVLPIEVHEILDHVSGLGAIAAPFALGYQKK